VQAFWSRAMAGGAVAAATPLPSVVEPFGDSQELADELVVHRGNDSDVI
jgi:hypothetical protein